MKKIKDIKSTINSYLALETRLNIAKRKYQSNLSDYNTDINLDLYIDDLYSKMDDMVIDFKNKTGLLLIDFINK